MTIHTTNSELERIADSMRKHLVPEETIQQAIKLAPERGGIRDLIDMWMEEEDFKEKDCIIQDIEDMIEVVESPTVVCIRCSELDEKE